MSEKITVEPGHQGALRINGQSIGRIERMGAYTFVMLDRADGDRERLTVPQEMSVSEIPAWVQDYLNKNPKMVADLALDRQEDGGSVNSLGSAPNGRLLRKADRTAREVLEVCHALVRGGIK
jgi:hypothetical protein